VHVRRLADGLLTMNLGGADIVLHAMSMTRFYCPTTDVQCEFNFSGPKKEMDVSVGDEHVMRMERLEP
jgi:hypothetical protein